MVDMNIILASRFQWDESDIVFFSNGERDKVFLCPDEENEIPISHNEVDVVIGNWFFKYHNIDEFKRLKYIQLLSAGFNGIDPKIAEERNIVLYNAKDVYSIPISEFVVGSILFSYKKGYYFYRNQCICKWEKNRALQELYNKRVLIVGTGSIGHEIALRIGSFTEYVYGCNRTLRQDKSYKLIYPIEQLGRCVKEMDIVILTIAHTQETDHLINSRILSNMKKDVLIVNVSRGGVIDESALIEFIDKKRIGGAILDVFEDEPLSSDSPLWHKENVIITPHNAFASDKNNGRLRKLIRDNYTAWGT